MSHIKSNFSFETLRKKTRRLYNASGTVAEECTCINTRRMYLLAIIAIPLRIINILLFTYTEAGEEDFMKLWRHGIIASHAFLLVFMIVLFLVTRKLRNRKECNTAMKVLQYVAVAVILASGIAIVTFDQLVTTNISPFILICVVVGLVFLLRPMYTLITYVVSYIAYYIMISLTISDSQILLSNRVNGISAIGIGYLISVLMWYYSYLNITQKRHIELHQRQLEQMAYYDPLTDLPNRRLLEKMIEKEFSLMKLYRHETVIIILDIDNFKIINDTYGHLAGDLILRQLADLLKSFVRERDTVARFGGEEFLILMPKSPMDEGYQFAERLREEIMNHKFFIGSSELQVTASFGISSICDITSKTFEDYYILADKALYIAKQKGRNRVEKA